MNIYSIQDESPVNMQNIPDVAALRNLINAPIPPIPSYPDIGGTPDMLRVMDRQNEIRELQERNTWDPRNQPILERMLRPDINFEQQRAIGQLGESYQRGVLDATRRQEMRNGMEILSEPIWDPGYGDAPLSTSKGESYPWNYQWYIQQMAQNKGDGLYSTKKGIREANEFGGAPLGNDILHPSHVVDLPKQRRQGVFDPIREAAIAQGLLRPTNRWREKLKVPHRQRMVAQQSRTDLMCLQRWRTSGPDYPELLAINPNIAPRTALGGTVRGGYKPYRKIGARNTFGPY